MDWFERLTGFREGGYEDTRSRLEVDGRDLRSLVNGRRYGIGELELVSLQSLRERVAAGTIYRNYFVPVGGERGQTSARQLDGLAGVGAALGQALGRPVDALWTMRNGYALCRQEGLTAIGTHLRGWSADEIDALRGLLRIGVHRDVEVTDVDGPPRPVVSQAFCSALPVAYTDLPAALWRPFAELVLDAAYEAMIWAAVLNAQRGASNVLLLTRLGGGVFRNDEVWIDAAMRRALAMAVDFALDVRVISLGMPSRSMLELEEAFG